MKRNQWTAIGFALLIFCFGVGVGALGQRYYSGQTVNAKEISDDFRHRYISEMKSKLNLTPAQVNQLNTILDETKAKFRAVRDSVHPAMVKIKEEQVARVKGILSASQVPAYEALVAERERKAREQEDRERHDERTKAGSIAAPSH